MKYCRFAVVALFFAHIAAAQAQSANIDIKGTSLSELMNMQITSFSGKKEDLNKTPAAVYVVTSDEIKRMGVTQLAETLRYIPGLEIARTGANTWAISIRGFNGVNANKLLVMIDGRSVYSTLYSGVLWQQQDVLLDDIARIEIIRGPGGVLWGTNAVNGVINIITKDSKDTQGVLATAGAGTLSQVAQAHVGRQLGADTYGRVFVKAMHEKTSPDIPIDDSSKMIHTGFRIDKHSTSMGDMTWSGDIYRGGIGPTLQGLTIQTNAQAYNGNNLLFNWLYHANEDRSYKLLAYIDNTKLNASGILIDNRGTINLNTQIIQRWRSQEFTGGLGYRRVSDTIPTLFPFQIIPLARIDRTYSGFIQDDVAFLSDKAHLIFGTKYEHNNYTGSEWQPSIRTSYVTANDSLLWASWSRAVRVPTRLEENLVFSPLFFGNTRLKSESANVYEIGWRKDWEKRINMDITAYTSKYINLVTIERNTEGNKMSGNISGIELSPSFQLRPNWLLRFNYSHAWINMGVSQSSLAAAQAITTENTLPRDMSQLVSMWDINERWQLNGFLRYVSEVKAQQVPAYAVADASVVWKANNYLSWQLVARDLGKKHLEWGTINSPRVAPSIALYVTVKV